jgi:hypothetical protein
MIREWLADLDSALLVYDEGGGLRFLLGADPVTGWALRELCTDQTVFTGSFVMSPAIAALSDNLAAAIAPEEGAPPLEPAADYGDALQLIQTRFNPELLDVLTSQIQRLIADDGLPASEIAILAPFVSDSLRFSITNRLETLGIPWRSHRPSRSLRDEPSAHALLTLAALGHPAWDVHPPKSDLAYAFMQSIEGLDLVRAQILAEIVYRPRDLTLTSFDAIKPDMQERITFSVGLRYSMLRDWLLAYREDEPLPFDHFLRRLFGEVLSQPGFGFRSRLDAIRVAASLIESIKRFRQATESTQADFPNLGTEYINMLQDGVIAAQYIETWQIPDVNAVLVAPAYTFLMMNRPVTVQFWLDAGSSGWSERLAQPLTHPYVLSRGWPPGRVWTDADEVEASQRALARLITGLLHRCRERLYVGLAEMGESGFEERSGLLRAFQRVTSQSNTE